MPFCAACSAAKMFFPLSLFLLFKVGSRLFGLDLHLFETSAAKLYRKRGT